MLIERRLRAHRIRRRYDKVMRVSGKVGTYGAAVLAVTGAVVYHLGGVELYRLGWPLCLLGLTMVMAGAGFACEGEAPTVQAYAEGDSDEMPGVARLVNGALAAIGGVLLCTIGIQVWIA